MNKKVSFCNKLFINSFITLILISPFGSCHFNSQVSFEELSNSKKKHPDTEWILKILNYESCCGSPIGTGVQYWGYTGDQFANNRPKTIEEAITMYYIYFLPFVKKYPNGAKERLGDFYFNTGRTPEKLLLFTSDLISLSQLKSKESFKNIWEKNKIDLLKKCREKGFQKKIDDAKVRYYTSISCLSYETTWKKRIFMWD